MTLFSLTLSCRRRFFSLLWLLYVDIFYVLEEKKRMPKLFLYTFIVFLAHLWVDVNLSRETFCSEFISAALWYLDTRERGERGNVWNVRVHSSRLKLPPSSQQRSTRETIPIWTIIFMSLWEKSLLNVFRELSLRSDTKMSSKSYIKFTLKCNKKLRVRECCDSGVKSTILWWNDDASKRDRESASVGLSELTCSINLH